MTAMRGKRLALLALCLVGMGLFAALGIWQLHRLAWKRELIARVEARIHAPPMPVPSRDRWSSLDASDLEYRRVEARGVFQHDKETLVDALTERGAGAWVLTPLRTDGGTLLVNRGFVPPERRDPRSRAAAQRAGEVTVTGLLRLTEPHGRFLRPNEPAADRWFSRDVVAIAKARSLEEVAPFFIDAEAQDEPEGGPVGGLTVVRFRNAHLPYALTWFALAALCAAGCVVVSRT